jgi:hypothetical protein
VAWYVDGKRFERGRWPIEPGVHRIRAIRGGESDEVAVEVLQ